MADTAAGDYNTSPRTPTRMLLSSPSWLHPLLAGGDLPPPEFHAHFGPAALERAARMAQRPRPPLGALFSSELQRACLRTGHLPHGFADVVASLLDLLREASDRSEPLLVRLAVLRPDDASRKASIGGLGLCADSVAALGRRIGPARAHERLRRLAVDWATVVGGFPSSDFDAILPAVAGKYRLDDESGNAALPEEPARIAAQLTLKLLAARGIALPEAPPAQVREAAAALLARAEEPATLILEVDHDDGAAPAPRRRLFHDGVAEPFATGKGNGAGAASGRLALSREQAARYASSGLGVVLLATSRSAPIDPAVAALWIAAGTAPVLDLPIVIGPRRLLVDRAAAVVRLGDALLREGDAITLDADRGAIFVGALPLVDDAAP